VLGELSTYGSGSVLLGSGAVGSAAYTASTAYATAAQGTKADNAGAVTGAVKSNGSATFSQAACGDLSNGASGCSTTVGTAATHAATDFQLALTNPVTGPGSATANDAVTFTGTGDQVQDSGVAIYTIPSSNLNLGGGLPLTYGGASSIAIGNSSTLASSTGTVNIAIGTSNLLGASGSFNIAIGAEAIGYGGIETGSNNIGLGDSALYNLTSGGNNIGIGNNTLATNSSGSYSTGIGSGALQFTTTGNGNTAAGYLAGTLLPTGYHNITGSYGTFLGQNTQASANGNTNEIVVGSTAVGAGSNTAVIGNAAVTDEYFGSAAGLATLHGAAFTGNSSTATNLSTNGTANQVWGMNSGATAQGWQTPGSTMTYPGANTIGVANSGNTAWRTPLYSDITALFGSGSCSGALMSSGGCTALPSVGTWGALNYPTWTTGTPFVKMTAAGTFALDTNTYGTFTLPSLTSGSVLFSNGSTIAQDNSNFFWDATNHRLGIGTTGPSGQLSLGNPSTDTNLRTYGISDQGVFNFYQAQNFPTAGIYARILDIVSGSQNTLSQIRFLTQNDGLSGPTEKVRIDNNGNVGIGTTSPVQALDLGTGALRTGGLTIAGNPTVFANPIVINGQTPPAFIYLDSTYNVLRIGAQSTYTTLAFELPGSPAYEDVMQLTATGLNPAPAFDNTINLGVTGQRWKSLWVGTGGGIFQGNVGIGTTSPAALLSVGSSSQFQVSSTGVSSAGAGSTDLNGSGVPEAHCLADGTGCPGGTLYNAAGTQLTSAHTVMGLTTLSGGAATVTFSGSAIFTSSSSYACMTSATVSTINLNALGVTYTSGSSVTFSDDGGLGSDAIRYICIGN
jgi:hypothetical protein